MKILRNIDAPEIIVGKKEIETPEKKRDREIYDRLFEQQMRDAEEQITKSKMQQKIDNYRKKNSAYL